MNYFKPFCWYLHSASESNHKNISQFTRNSCLLDKVFHRTVYEFHEYQMCGLVTNTKSLDPVPSYLTH